MTDTQTKKIKSIKQFAELSVIDIRNIVVAAWKRQQIVQSKINSLEAKDYLSDAQEEKLDNLQEELDELESIGDEFEELLEALEKVVDITELMV